MLRGVVVLALLALAAAAPNDGGANGIVQPRTDAQGRPVVTPPHVVINDWPLHVIPIANANVRPSPFPPGINVFEPLRARELFQAQAQTETKEKSDAAQMPPNTVTNAPTPPPQAANSGAQGTFSQAGGNQHDTIVLSNGNHVTDLRNVPSLVEEKAKMGEDPKHDTIVVSNGNKITDVRRARQHAFVETEAAVERRRPHDTIVLSNSNKVTQIHRIHTGAPKKGSSESGAPAAQSGPAQAGPSRSAFVEMVSKLAATRRRPHDTIVLSNSNKVTQIHRIHTGAPKKGSSESGAPAAQSGPAQAGPSANRP